MKYLFGLLALIVTLSPLSAQASNQKGKVVYDQHCQVCHNPNTAPLMKAPPAHDTSAWKVRIKQAKAAVKTDKSAKDAIGVLVQSVKNGKGTMPPSGMCTECTNKDFRAAIEYMSTKENSGA